MFAFFKKRNVRLKRQQEYLDLIDDTPIDYNEYSHLPKKLRYIACQIPERYMIFFCLLISVFIISLILFLVSIAKSNIFNKSDLVFGILTLICIIGFATLYISSKISSTTNSALQKVWDTVNISETRLIGVSQNVDIALKLIKSVKTDLNDIQIKIHSLGLKGVALNEEESARLKDLTKSLSLLENTLEETMNDFVNEKRLSKSIMSEQLGYIHGLNSKIFYQLNQLKILNKPKESDTPEESDIPDIDTVDGELDEDDQKMVPYKEFKRVKDLCIESRKAFNDEWKIGQDLQIKLDREVEKNIKLQEDLEKADMNRQELNETKSQLKVLQQVLFESKVDNDDIGSQSSLDSFLKRDIREKRMEEFFSSTKSTDSKSFYVDIIPFKPTSTLTLASNSSSNNSGTSETNKSNKSVITKVTTWIDSFAEKP